MDLTSEITDTIETTDTNETTDINESSENTDTNEKSDTTDTNETTDDSKKTNDWNGFLSAVLKALTTVLLLGILGANFVYLTRINTNLFFPSDPEQRPYTDKNKNGNMLPPLFGEKNINMKGGNGNLSGCGTPIDITTSKLLENKYFRGTFEYGFPYTMEISEEDKTFGQTISSWFSNKVKYSYIWLRTVEKTIISFFESFCAMSPDSARDIIPFILGPFIIKIIFLITSLWFIPSMISVFVNEDVNNRFGIWISILGLFLGWTWFVPLMTTFVQIFTSMFKFVVLPVMMNAKEIISIIGKTFNAWWLKIIFFILVISAAFKHLNLTIAIIMLIVFLIQSIPPGMNPMSKSSEGS
jgi:hypothetical protein